MVAGLAAAIGAVIAGVAIWRYMDSEESPQARAYRFEVFPPEGASFAMSPAFMSVSPDGRSLAWHGPNAEGQTGVWLRSLDSLTAHMIKGAEGGVQPFWSPDGRFIAFNAAGKLKKIPVAGGLAQTLSEQSRLPEWILEPR